VGIDLSSAQPRASDSVALDDYGVVVILSSRDAAEQSRVEGAREVIHWTFTDPSEVAATRNCNCGRSVEFAMNSAPE
jgi:hypothetical protein